MPVRGKSLRLWLRYVGLLVAGAALASIVLGCGSGGGAAGPPHPARTATSVRSQPPSVAAPSGAAVRPRRAHRAAVPLRKLVGQRVMVRMEGTSADPGLLARIRDGEAGGVILYADNIDSPAQTRGLIDQLQRAARAGGNPPLLISTDQEGGQVKRLDWAPPDIPPPEMGAQGAATSRRQGTLTARALRSVGINVDLAPVVDVAHSESSFIWQQGRSFGMSAHAVTDSAVPFAAAMRSAGVAPTAKHFPGVGGALTDTDYGLQKIIDEPEDLVPYRALIAERIPLIMVSTGLYPNLDGSAPAALSRRIIGGLLRGELAYRGVIITDDLERPTGYSTGAAVVRAAAAGADIILVSSTEGGGATAYHAILGAAERGAISRQSIATSYRRILRLKRGYAH